MGGEGEDWRSLSASGCFATENCVSEAELFLFSFFLIIIIQFFNWRMGRNRVFNTFKFSVLCTRILWRICLGFTEVLLEQSPVVSLLPSFEEEATFCRQNICCFDNRFLQIILAWSLIPDLEGAPSSLWRLDLKKCSFHPLPWTFLN